MQGVVDSSSTVSTKKKREGSSLSFLFTEAMPPTRIYYLACEVLFCASNPLIQFARWRKTGFRVLLSPPKTKAEVKSSAFCFWRNNVTTTNLLPRLRGIVLRFKPFDLTCTLAQNRIQSSTVSTKKKREGSPLSFLFAETMSPRPIYSNAERWIVLRFKPFDLICALAQNRIQSSTVLLYHYLIY